MDLMNDGFSLLAVSLILGVLFIVLAIPLIRRRVPPNHWYGLRVPATFAHERVWYEANARMGRDLLVLGILVIALGALLYGATMPAWLSVLLWSAFVLSGVIFVTVRSWRFANHLLERYKSETGTTPPNKTPQHTR
ncbi:SdpI family protein [Candidatus Parcubacteria bacterium]|nr:MAG: SdpI family protein [Candidatus Parcubacteria bacterium]